VNTGKLKFAVHVLEQGNFLDPTDEVMSNTAKILKGVCIVWIVLRDLRAVKLGTQTKDKQINSLNSNFYCIPTYAKLSSVNY